MKRKSLTTLGPVLFLNFPIFQYHLVSIALKLKHFKAFSFLLFWKYKTLNKGGKKRPHDLDILEVTEPSKFLNCGPAALPSPNTEQIFSPEFTAFLLCPSLKDFCMIATPASFLFFLFWPISYLAGLSVKYSLVKLEFSQMPSYLKWLGEYSDHLSMSLLNCYWDRLAHIIWDRKWIVSVAMVTARIGGSCLQVIFVF